MEKKKVLAEMLVDYRSTPHCTVGKSPFELMYGRKMKNKLRLFSPEIPKEWNEEDTEFRLKVEKKQEIMKRNNERRNPIRGKEIAKGDWVRVKGKDGWYRDYTR